MRPRLLLAAALVLALGGITTFYLLRPPLPAPPKPVASVPYTSSPPPASPPRAPSPVHSAPASLPPPLPADLAPLVEPTTYLTDASAAEVFRRAFWREPTPADRILHAERREWIGERDGVRRWQWFLVLDPGPEFTAWLRERNPFNLAPTPLAQASLDPATQPAWFPADATALREVEVHQSLDGAMTFLTEKSTGRLYATDRGHGFAASTPPQHPAANGHGLIPGREQPLRIPGDVRRSP